ncbi:MAG: type 4a pilus biogenesis protein PilO [Phycisphaerales bacterium]|nr:type 4a pilus biogenesis protein PilO [Phycisphaerales bacterium]
MRFGIREVVFVMVLLAMPLSAWWLIFRPQNREIMQARSEIEHKERMLEKLAAATQKSADLARANDEIAKGIGLVEGRLPSGKEVEIVLDQIAQLARASKLNIPSVKSLKPVAAARYMEQPLEITVHGDFDQFYGFMLRLEQMERVTRVPQMKLERSTKREDDGVMSATFTLSIYFQPDGPAAATASASGDAR